jgi:hypothetical protein
MGGIGEEGEGGSEACNWCITCACIHAKVSWLPAMPNCRGVLLMEQPNLDCQGLILGEGGGRKNPSP